MKRARGCWFRLSGLAGLGGGEDFPARGSNLDCWDAGGGGGSVGKGSSWRVRVRVRGRGEREHVAEAGRIGKRRRKNCRLTVVAQDN